MTELIIVTIAARMRQKEGQFSVLASGL